MLLFIILGFADVRTAQAGSILEFFFPMLKEKKHPPSETLQAPFAKKTASNNNTNTGLPEDSIELNLPHRTPFQVADWLTKTTSESLTFTNPDQTQNLQSLQKYFTEDGWRLYSTFLNQTNIQKVLETNRYTIRAFVEEQPLLLNKGALGGSYKWLYEVPIMVTYLKKGQSDYKTQAGESATQKIILNIQVGRTEKEDADNGLLIEIWSGKVLSASKNEL